MYSEKALRVWSTGSSSILSWAGPSNTESYAAIMDDQSIIEFSVTRNVGTFEQAIKSCFEV